MTYETKCNTQEFVLCKSRKTSVVSLERSFVPYVSSHDTKLRTLTRRAHCICILFLFSNIGQMVQLSQTNLPFPKSQQNLVGACDDVLRGRALATAAYNYILWLILFEFFSLKNYKLTESTDFFFFLLSTGYDPPGGVKITPLLKAALNDLKPRAKATKHKVALKLLLKSCTQDCCLTFSLIVLNAYC